MIEVRYAPAKTASQTVVPGRDFYLPAIAFVAFCAPAMPVWAAIGSATIIMHIGLGAAEGGLDIRRITLQVITFVGTCTYAAADFRATAAAMFAGSLGPRDWYETRPLADGSAAFTDIHKGSVEIPKTIQKP